MTQSASNQRLVEVDGLRGMAALGVAIFHLRVLLQGLPNPLNSVWGTDLILLKGWHLVDLFFVLSGFIFAHCYLRDGAMRAGVSLGEFASARISRLWPLHAAVLLFTALMLRGDPSTTAYNFLMSLALLHVFLPDIEVLNPPVWSISVEMICYGLFAALAFQRNRLVFLLGSIIFALIGLGLTWSGEAPMIGRGLLGFFLGTLVYRFRDLLGALPAPALCLCLAPFLFLDGSMSSLLIQTALCWPAAIILAPRLEWLRGRAFQWLGSRSYAIYIVHIPIYIFVGNLVALLPETGGAIIVVAGLGTALLVADILHRHIEGPAQKFLRGRLFTRSRTGIAGIP
ncbi:MAG: acyltransferase [Pseudomonadota bacterium]